MFLRGAHVVNEIRPNLRGTVAYDAEFDVAFYAALWSLVADGIIVPGQPRDMYVHSVGVSAVTFPHFTLTPYGNEILSKPQISNPHDSSTYLDDARHRLGPADEVIFTYLGEAIKNFNDRSYLSATVMLGVSAEGLMKWLIKRFLEHLPEAKSVAHKKTFDELGNRTERLFTSFVKSLDSHYTEFNRDLEYQARAYLDQISSIIRVNRDDVGHGRVSRVDNQLVYGNLTVYPTLLSVARELADAFAIACDK